MVNARNVDGWYDRARDRYDAEPGMWVGVVVWAVLALVGALFVGWLG
jgi:hypothetical protein